MEIEHDRSAAHSSKWEQQNAQHTYHEDEETARHNTCHSVPPIARGKVRSRSPVMVVGGRILERAWRYPGVRGALETTKEFLSSWPGRG